MRKKFLTKYYPASKTTRHVDMIHNFKQEWMRHFIWHGKEEIYYGDSYRRPFSGYIGRKRNFEDMKQAFVVDYTKRHVYTDKKTTSDVQVDEVHVSSHELLKTTPMVGPYILPIPFLDFVIIDMVEDTKVLIILGRTFFTTSCVMIGVLYMRISVKVENGKFIFYVDKCMRYYSYNDDSCYYFDLIDMVVHDHVHGELPNEQLDLFLVHKLEGEFDQNHEVLKVENIWDEYGSGTDCTSIRRIEDGYTAYIDKPVNVIDGLQALHNCEESDLVLNWQKCHVMVREGIVLSHNTSSACVEMDKAKVDVIAKFS
ncbi:hypothetical protein Tco_0672575 [Tanacetum coccineum]